MTEKEMKATLIALGYTVIAPKTREEKEKDRIINELWEKERDEALAYGEPPNMEAVELAYENLIKQKNTMPNKRCT
jgi:hypothetical protein